jgi:hypothetical protein
MTTVSGKATSHSGHTRFGQLPQFNACGRNPSRWWPSAIWSLAPADALLEEGLLGGVGGELEGAFVGGASLVWLPEGSEELGASGVEEVIALARRVP